MANERELRDFSGTLRNDTLAAREELGEDSPLSWDMALTQVGMGYIGDAGEVSTDDTCPHEDLEGRDRCKITACNLDDDGVRLDIFTAHHVDTNDPWNVPIVPREDVKRVAHRALRFVRFAAARDFKRFEASPEAAAVAKEVRRRIATITEVVIHVFTDGLVRDHDLPIEDEDGRRNRVQIWDLEYLRRAASNAENPEIIVVDFTKLMGRPLPVLEMKPPSPEYQTFMAVLPGEVLCMLYDEFRAKLFERNVRSFLQVTGKVNKGIRKTLAEEPDRFLAYNNGLTATAVDIDVGQWHGETVIKTLRGLQIVNGAQTTASIHRAKTVDKLDISRVAVAMKLTGVKAEKLDEFVLRISDCANTQNPVQIADLSANTPFHVQLERLANSIYCPDLGSRWFYERARGAYEVERSQATGTAAKRKFDAERPKAQRFDKVELAKFWMTCYGKPYIVCRGRQKNYAAFMKELAARYPLDWVPDEHYLKETTAIALLFRTAYSLTRKAKLGSYLAQVATYMLGRLLEDHADTMNLQEIWDRQGCSDELKAVFVSWAPLVHARLVSSAGKENVGEWAKREECWKVIEILALPWPEEGTSEFRADEDDSEADVLTEATSKEVIDSMVGHAEMAASRPQVPKHDIGNPYVARCMGLDAGGWSKVMNWATSPEAKGLFNPKDLNIANQVALWAKLGWTGTPSEKQAYCAAKVIAGAEKQQVI